MTTLFTVNCFAQKTKLNTGTPISIRIVEAVNSKDPKIVPTAIVDKDVKDLITGKIFIRRGTPVELNTEIAKAKGAGKPGSIQINCISTTAVDGQIISLLGGSHVTGDSRKGAALGCGLGLGLTFLFPEGLFLLCIKGKNAEIPAHTMLPNVVINDNYMIATE